MSLAVMDLSSSSCLTLCDTGAFPFTKLRLVIAGGKNKGEREKDTPFIKIYRLIRCLIDGVIITPTTDRRTRRWLATPLVVTREIDKSKTKTRMK